MKENPSVCHGWLSWPWSYCCWIFIDLWNRCRDEIAFKAKGPCRVDTCFLVVSINANVKTSTRVIKLVSNMQHVSTLLWVLWCSSNGETNCSDPEYKNIAPFIYSETCLNQTLNKPKTCLNQTDFTVPSTKCLCNLDLCKPNTCVNWTSYSVPKGFGLDRFYCVWEFRKIVGNVL